jgi:hypothetical protein
MTERNANKFTLEDNDEVESNNGEERIKRRSARKSGVKPCRKRERSAKFGELSEAELVR